MRNALLEVTPVIPDALGRLPQLAGNLFFSWHRPTRALFEDLDRELPQTLLHFVSSHLELKNSLERAKAEMEEASKAARAEARKKSGSQITKKDPAGNSRKPAVAPEAPAPAKAEPSKAASLFDIDPEPVRSDGDNGSAAGSARPAIVASETDEDEEILREAYQEGDGEEDDEAA